MRRNYMAFCEQGGLVAMAVADTIEELTSNAKNAWRWAEKGLTVELKETPKDTPLPSFCEKMHKGICKMAPPCN
ncbi:hypothetical protein [Geomonas subterranea]|uniref:hypothetical protein n=1 Tax=Geomonas subterranea TaxID=2847989 RepID=UPI001CD1C035|nr:hypothetical protein [Geomonas fuzhouensis]